jgi:thioredoxin-like negative regulator of GroEL
MGISGRELIGHALRAIRRTGGGREKQTGSIILDAVSGREAENKVVFYLSRLFEDAPFSWVSLLIKRTPVLLIEEIDARQAEKIVRRLTKLGAHARFLPADQAAAGDGTAPDKTEEEEAARSAKGAPFVRLPRALRIKPLWDARRRLIAGGAALLLLLTLLFYFFPSVRGISHFGASKGRGGASSGRHLSEFTAVSGVAAPSVMDVPVQEMYQAFLYQYRPRADRRFLKAFNLLPQRYAQLRGAKEGEGVRVGAMSASGEKVVVPLVKTSRMQLTGDVARIAEVSLPLPAGFTRAKFALDECLSAIRKEDGEAVLPKAPAMDGYRLDMALAGINSIDPRGIVYGLGVLEGLWQEGRRDALLLRAAARAYSLLIFVLTPDTGNAAEDLASEALVFLTLARYVNPGLSLDREEALLALGMGYPAHAAALFSRQSGPSAEDKMLYAYLRQDARALSALKGQYPQEVLGHYLFARLTRELDMGRDARQAAFELLGRFPSLYPSAVEGIHSCDPDTARKVSALYVADIVRQPGLRISSDSAKRPGSWLGRPPSDSRSPGAVSLARYETLLREWLPFPQDKQVRFLVDHNRIRAVFRSAYADAVGQRFDLLLGRSGDAGAARAHVESVGSRDKNDALVLFMLAAMFSSTGDRQSADALYAQIVNSKAAPPAIACAALDLLSNPVDAIHLLPRIADQLDGRPRHTLFLGRQLHRHGLNPDLSLAYLTSGLAEDPYAFWAYRYLALVRGADDVLLKALQKFPRSVALAEESARYFAAKGDDAARARALGLFKWAQELAPAKVSIVRKRAGLLVRSKRSDEAVRVLTDWITTNRDTDVTTLSGVKALRAGLLASPKQALKSLGKGTDMREAGVLLVSARAKEQLRKPDAAAKEYAYAVERYPKSLPVRRAAAGFYWRRGEYTKAGQVISGGRSAAHGSAAWYVQEFISRFAGVSDEKTFQAAWALSKAGAPMQEVRALAVALDKQGRHEAALNMLSDIKDKQPLTGMENLVAAYKLLRSWKGKEAARRYLRQRAAPAQAHLLTIALRAQGLSEEVLDDAGEPDAAPAQYREFMWLQKAAAWLDEERKAAHIGARLQNHYERTVRDHYHYCGRFLMGYMAFDELARHIDGAKQRCEFAYYAGLSARMKSNFAEAANWYHVAVETLAESTPEFHWARNELRQWTRVGTDRRNRLLRDDIAAATPDVADSED